MSGLSGIDLAQPVRNPLLNRSLPVPEGLELAVRTDPIKDRAADFFDGVRMRDGRIIYFFGDAAVPEDAMGPLLFSTGAHALTRAFLEQTQCPEETLRLLNEVFHEELELSCFCMCSFLVVDPIDKTIRHIGAGQQAYLVDPQGRYIDRLKSTGLPLGLFLEATYEVNLPVLLEAGDAILLVSDGFPQTLSPDHHIYGIERVFGSLENHAEISLDEATRRLFRSRRQFQGSARQREDASVLILRAEC